MSSGPYEDDQDGPSKERETLIETTNDVSGTEGSIGQSVKDGQIKQSIESVPVPAKETAALLQEGESVILPQDTITPSSADLVRSASTTSAGQDGSQNASNGVSSSSVPISSPGLASANAVKKFNSLSVTKQFLQKASPTLSNAAAATPLASTKVTSGMQSGQSLSSSSRLSSMMPASRLTSAKLTNSSKPAGAGWAQVSSPASTPRTAVDSNAALSGANANPASAAPAQSTPTTNESAPTPSPAPAIAPHSSISASINAPSPAAPSPKLVTALSGRSTSPHIRNSEGNKGSPGLRNAAIAGSGRSASPSVNNTAGNLSRAPWAAVKTDTKASTKGIGRRSDFPTAAEAAQAKLEAEKKEKAAAAEAALKAEQALQNLEKFRGTSLGTHWDEMDDDDFGEGELQFGDGSSYRVPAQQVEKQITKEERFRDVGHDRTWSGQNSSQGGQRTIPAVKPSQPPERTKPHKVETVAVRSGEGISLDAPSHIDRGPSFYGGGGGSGGSGGHQKERRSSFLGRSRESRDDHSHSSVSHPAPPVAQVRAWGPLAQRQASLNPDAPKPVSAVPIAVQSPPSSSTSGREVIKQDVNLGDEGQQERLTAEKDRSRKPTNPKPTTIVSPPTRPITDGRALPPHLALNRQSQPSQQPLHRHNNDLGTVERPDWQTAVPRQLNEEDAQPKEIIARPYGSFVASSRQSNQQSSKSNTTSNRPENSRRKESFSTVESAEDRATALERARKRKEAEEAERTKERERALAKAAAIEAKMREAEEAEKEKKRIAEEERQRLQKEAQKAEEAKKEAELLQQRNKAIRERNIPPRDPRNRTSSSSGDVPPHAALEVSTTSTVPGSSLLSPSDEAVSWRRGPKIPLQAAAPGMTEDADIRKEHRKEEVQPQRILLRRPEVQQKENSEDIKGVGKREQDHNILKKTIGREGKRSERSRVEIIAPTDEGAMKHMRAQQEREREARQNKEGNARVPVGVLKPITSKEVDINRQKAQRVSILPEPEQTRTEVPFDGAPVWNKFQIRLSKHIEKAKVRLNRDEFKSQQDRIAKAKDQSERFAPKPVSILSWSPPIVDLSARTLSRDDQFFPKKYRKGVRIANVIMPRASISKLAEENAKKKEIELANAIKAPKPVDSQSFNAGLPGVASTTSKPAVRVPAVSAISTDINPAIDSFDNRNAIPTGPRSQQRNRDVNGAVGFARSNIAREAATPSPVSFTVQSEVDAPIKVPSVMLGNNNLVGKKSASTSTWGDNSLTFAGLESSGNADSANSLIQNDSVDAENERNRIKDVWGSLPSDPANEPNKPTQNSLKDIVDDLPSTMSMSMDELRADDISSQPAESAHPTHTRLYSPMVDGSRGTGASNTVTRVGTNGGTLTDVAVMTASSSPINVASPSQSGHIFGVDDINRRANLHHQIGRARSQSPSSMRYSSSTTSNHLLGMSSPSSNNTTMTSAGIGGHQQRNMFVQQERTGARAAFGPYAYPSKPAYSSGMFSTPSQHQQQQQQQYSAYGSGQAGFNAQINNYGTADYGSGYGNNNAYRYNSRGGYRGNHVNPASSAMSGQNAIHNYDSFGNTANEVAFNAFDNRGAYQNTTMLTGSGGELNANDSSTSNFGNHEGMEDGGATGMATTASTAGWPLDSPAGSYMGSNYSTTQPNAYLTGFNSGSPATGASAYGAFGQQASHGMTSSFGRSTSQRNGFISGTGTYRGTNGAGGLMSNGYSNNGVSGGGSGQWGTRSARTYGTNPSDLTASTTNLYQAPQIYQTSGSKGFENHHNDIARVPAGTTLQATAKPFQLGGNPPSAGTGMSNREGRGGGGGSASRYQQQGYPKVSSGGSVDRPIHEMDPTSISNEGVQQQYTTAEYNDAYDANNGQW